RGLRRGIVQIDQGFDRAGAVGKFKTRVGGYVHIAIALEAKRALPIKPISSAIIRSRSSQGAIVSRVRYICYRRIGVAIHWKEGNETSFARNSAAIKVVIVGFIGNHGEGGIRGGRGDHAIADRYRKDAAAVRRDDGGQDVLWTGRAQNIRATAL